MYMFQLGERVYVNPDQFPGSYRRLLPTCYGMIVKTKCDNFDYAVFFPADATCRTLHFNAHELLKERER